MIQYFIQQNAIVHAKRTKIGQKHRIQILELSQVFLNNDWYAHNKEEEDKEFYETWKLHYSKKKNTIQLRNLVVG